MKHTTIIIIIAGLSLINLHGMENNTLTNYQKKCAIIVNKLTRKTNNFLENINKKPLKDVKKITTRQDFYNYLNKAHEEKENAVLQLKNYLNINDPDWQWCESMIKKTITQITTDINTSPGNQNQVLFPIKQKIALGVMLKYYGLNINKINIRQNQSIKDIAQYSCDISIDLSQHIITTAISQPTIIFSTSPTALTHYALLKTAHNFSSMITNRVIAYFLTKKSKNFYTITTLKETKAFKNLSTIDTKTSEIINCVLDYDTCKHITTQRSTIPFINSQNKYDLEHFEQLYDIKMLWQKKFALANICLTKAKTSPLKLSYIEYPFHNT